MVLIFGMLGAQTYAVIMWLRVPKALFTNLVSTAYTTIIPRAGNVYYLEALARVAFP